MMKVATKTTSVLSPCDPNRWRAGIYQPGIYGRAHARDIEHLLIELGKPTQNAYIENFNGKFRDEYLNE